MPCNNCANHRLVNTIEELMEMFKEKYSDMENEISVTSNVLLRCYGAKVSLTVQDREMGINLFDSMTRVTDEKQIDVIKSVLATTAMATSTVLDRSENDLPSDETPIIIDD